MELKKKVVKEIAAENNIQVDFSEFPEVVEQNGRDNASHQHKPSHEAIYQMDMDEGSESDSDHSAPHSEDPCDISTSDGSNNGHLEQKKVIASVRTR
jgi:vacuolar protein sorting-associated protein IST1